jgi:hypothetical protein
MVHIRTVAVMANLYFQEYESSTTVKVAPVAANSSSLRKSSRQKVAPTIFKPEPTESSPNPNKRKASSASTTESPNKMAKVAKQELGVKTEVMDVDQDAIGAAVVSTSKLPTLIKKEPSTDLAKSPSR